MSNFKIFLVFLVLKATYGKIYAWEQNKKNVLFLAADDLRPALGCYADSHPGFDAPSMHTPNLDALASKSILFERAYAQQALCSPSRTSLLTGRRPDTTRVTDQHHYFRNVGGNFTTIPQYFKEHGYYSVGAGKIFHLTNNATPNSDYPFSWSEPFYQPENNWSSKKHSWHALTPKQYNELPLPDTLSVQFAISKLRELAKNWEENKQPFFLALGTKKPHLPFIFPEEFLSLYPEKDIGLPKNPYAPSEMPDMAWIKFGELRTFADTSNDAMGIPDLGEVNVTYPNNKVKELRRAYYSAISFIDDIIGQILNELKTLGLENSTIVSFWGDHGWQLGEHSEWCKHTNFEVANHAPMMVKIPGLTDDGIRTSKLVELVDLFPTLVEAIGMEPLPTCPLNSTDVELCTEGSSLIPLVKNTNNKEWKDGIFWQYPRGGSQTDQCIKNRYQNCIRKCMGYSIRTNNHHYTEWVHLKVLEDSVSWKPLWNKPCDHSELYDLVNDPRENHNLYNDQEYEEVILELSERLKKGWRNEFKQ